MFVYFVCFSLVIVLSLGDVKSQRDTRTIVTKEVLTTREHPRLKRWITACTSSNCANGHCVKPDVCACNDGYTKSNKTCVPVCEGDCSPGTCIAPNTCVCNIGYMLVNRTCQPDCTNPCQNGTCKYPDTCECKDGYYMSTYQHLNQTCQPRCTGGCPPNSFCDAPETCKCHVGWRLNDISTECLPVCKHPCGNGTCVGPDFCHCFPGFQKNWFRLYGYEVGPVCVNVTEDGNEDTTTTTKNPSTSTTTHNVNKYSTEEIMTTMTTTSITTTPYFVSSSSSTERFLDNNVNNNVPSSKMVEKSWLEQNKMFIWVPIVLILATALILLLIWQRTPMVIFNYFKGVKNRRMYNVQGAFQKENDSNAFGSLQFVRDESEAQV